MRASIVLLLAAAALAGGCSLSVDYTGTYYSCGERGECPDGYVCQSKVCIPVEPAAPTCSRGVAGGGDHTCSVRDDGTVWCWGRNDFGQLGDGSAVDSNDPVQAAGIANATTVVTGVLHSCALLEGGGVSCWGNNKSGQIGDGRNSDAKVPVPALVPGGMTALVAGGFHTCALDGSGAVWCWGYNDDGQLGDGGNLDRSMPAAIARLHRGRAVRRPVGDVRRDRRQRALLLGLQRRWPVRPRRQRVAQHADADPGARDAGGRGRRLRRRPHVRVRVGRGPVRGQQLRRPARQRHHRRTRTSSWRR